MPEERTCDYTGQPIEPGTGIMYVRSDGTVLHFVDSKAEKNYFLGREPRDLSWTAAGRAESDARREVEETDDTEAAASEDDEAIETSAAESGGTPSEEPDEPATEDQASAEEPASQVSSDEEQIESSESP